MAIFGVQLVLSMVMASVLSKLSTHFSFASWILSRHLVFFLPPSNEHLKNLSGLNKPYVKTKGRNRKHNTDQTSEKEDGFLIPKNIDIELEHAQISQRDLYTLHYYPELQWIIDFSFVTGIVYAVTEVYLTYFMRKDSNEFNLSILWLMLTIMFCMKYLIKVTLVYATGPNGRWIFCLTIALVFLVLAMIILIIDEKLLNFELQDSYANFTAAANIHLDKQNIKTTGPASILLYRSILAVLAAVVGGAIAFPGFRLAKTHNEALSTCTNPFIRLSLYVNQAFPFAICLLWLQPLNDQLIRLIPIDCDLECKQNMFSIWRLVLVLVFCVGRIFLIKYHLQAHLNSANDLIANLKKEAGRIRSTEVQYMVIRVYRYICVVAVQYLAPAIILISLTLMWKSMSAYSWSDFLSSNARISKVVVNTTAKVAKENVDDYALEKLSEIFTPILFRSVLSFSVWWMLLVWSANTGFALVYYAYFNKAL